jgi:hypothetical protein
LGESRRSVRTEIDKRRVVEQKLGDVAEDLSVANLDVARLPRQNRATKQDDRPGNRKAAMRGQDPGKYQGETNRGPHQSTSSGFTAQYKDHDDNKSPVST